LELLRRLSLFGDGLAAVAIEAFLPLAVLSLFQSLILNRVVAVSIRQISSSASIFSWVFLFFVLVLPRQKWGASSGKCVLDSGSWCCSRC
jgi:hypothetical protein